jgi:hypothetical protein
MLTYTACPAGDNQRLGLGARHHEQPSGWTVPAGAAARWFFDAPPGTAVVGIRADALFEQYDPRWQVGLSNGSQLIEGCPWLPSDPGADCVAGMFSGDYHPLPPSGTIYSEVYCARGPCTAGGAGQFWARSSITYAAVMVADGTTPGIGNPRGDLWSDGWVGGTRTAAFDAFDNTGIKEVRVLIDGKVMAQSGRGCDPTLKTCPDWPEASLAVATGNGIGDGKHTLALQAVDRGDNVGEAAREIRVDNTAPAAPQELAVVGGDGWKATNKFGITWKNPPQNAASIAGADYRLCSAAASTDCVTGSRAGNDLTSIDLEVPRPGAWVLTLWLRDAAGNARPETAAAPVYLRFDADPPALTIRPQDPDDPASVRVAASDATSGIAGGEIELRRPGSNTWRSMPAQLESGGISAMIDDEHLRDGVYELRARVWDLAANERSTDKRSSGDAARVVLPLRVKTRLRVGKTRKVRARRARRGRRTRIVYVRRPLVTQGRRVRVRGRLTAPGGNGLSGVDVEVSARLAIDGAGFQPVATLKTSRSGRFSYLVPAGPARILRFRYVGAAKIRPQTRDVHVRVRASSTIRVDRKSVVNGEAVTFTGKLRGGFLPGSGKLMELQFFDRGKWRTFRTFRAAPSDGRWSYSYRFDGTRGTRRYRFRVRIPKEGGYPYSTGSSRRVAVKVRGL